MVAQLKQPELLKSSYGIIDLKYVDFTVNLDVHEDVETRIPK